MDIYSYRLSEGHDLPHNPIPAILGPRPIGWISTCDAQGKHNLAPYSFFNIVNYFPPIVMFSSVGKKHTTCNAEATGEFVYNLATRPLAEKMNHTSIDAPAGTSEFELAELPTLASDLVKPLRVAESPVTMECKVISVEQLTDAQNNKLDTWITYGEVVAVHIDRALLKEGIYDTAAAQPVMRAGGPADYFEIMPEGYFKMYRPKI